ncbi:MAG: diaminopropionate ammonia-lyase [Gammaproteobacteria bacterium]|nr:diaminopropionate ammonia-lyase [Gammaproteobacteria bacterium]
MNSFVLTCNPAADHTAPYGAEQSAVLAAEQMRAAAVEIRGWPGYRPTALVSLPGLAAALGIAALHYKDEGTRFGLGSFKPLGGAYAVFRAVAGKIAEWSGKAPSSRELLDGASRDLVRKITVCAATDGNHGRSVAWGARTFGCRCVIYITESVTPAREQAIAAYGAEVVRNPGSYDDAVRAVAARAGREGWLLIPDTSDGAVVDAPRDVMAGYTLMAEEAIAQLPDAEPPTHLFLQAGVGGMAAAVCAKFWQTFASRRPFTICVEPRQCACWYHSLVAGHPLAVTGEIDSVMAGLACGEVSLLAWSILRTGADAAMTVEDPLALAAMRLLAKAPHGDRPLVGGESGVAGLAGLLAVAGDQQARASIGLDHGSRVLLFGTEGDTDAENYNRLVGRSGAEVRQSAAVFDGESR